MPATKSKVLDKKQIEQKIIRIAHQIHENNYEEKTLVMAGIADRGYTLAQRLAKELEKISDIKIELIKLKIDKDNPMDNPIDYELDQKKLKNKVVILVDDVLNSGKTLIYGAKHFLKVPLKRLLTAVLVNRNHRRFPIHADYTGLTLATTLKEHVTVTFGKNGKEAVYLE